VTAAGCDVGPQENDIAGRRIAPKLQSAALVVEAEVVDVRVDTAGFLTSATRQVLHRPGEFKGRERDPNR
jgi:hypothetical protein